MPWNLLRSGRRRLRQLGSRAAGQPLPAFYDFVAAVELEGRDGSVEHASATSVVTLHDELDAFAMTTVKQHHQWLDLDRNHVQFQFRMERNASACYFTSSVCTYQ